MYFLLYYIFYDPYAVKTATTAYNAGKYTFQFTFILNLPWTPLLFRAGYTKKTI
jgi:hypothetical protein